VLKYIKAAFVNRWNILAFLGGVGFSLVSGQPDILLPLVLAGETAYLGFLGTHPKFQRHIDAQQAKVARESSSHESTEVLKRILKSLPDASRKRYAELLNRCQHLRQIASDLKHPGASFGASLDSLQMEGLDRLLWIFLRLLFTEHSIARFLQHTAREGIEREAQRIEVRLNAIKPDDESAHTAKIRRTLDDSLATTRGRLENYDRALSNHEFVQLEIARLENKIKSLAELAVNRQEPDYISSQIDQVAHSMLDTEKTMNDLQYVTGLEAVDDSVPPIIQNTVRAQ
jgi:hypothetical protein